MIYLYAITEQDVVPPESLGLQDEPVKMFQGAALAAVYSNLADVQIRPDAQALWRHDEIVERAMSAGPALPVRFGTTFADTGALASVLDCHTPRLRRALERVRGCVELAVRVGLPPTNDSTATDGREYLRGRLALRRERQAAVELTLEPLAELAVCARAQGPRSETAVIAASYLVQTDEVERFAEAVRKLQQRNAELSLSCTGPWPPYSFAGAEEEPL